MSSAKSGDLSVRNRDGGCWAAQLRVTIHPAFHRYFSIVENHRIASDKTVQRTVLYLGEINDQQQVHAPGLTPTAVLEKLADIKMIDVWIPTVDQRWLILPRYTQPSPDTKLLIEKLKLHLPSQPPPRLVARKESSEIEVQTVR